MRSSPLSEVAASCYTYCSFPTHSQSTVSKTRQPWLSGPVPDLLWGSGAAYLGVFALLVMAGPWVPGTLPAGTMMALVVLVSMPHYGATLLRVYEKREERQAYAFFAKYTTILLGLAFVWGLNNVAVGSLLFTIYLTWSPWHYTGQNYGVALMFLGRQGVKVSQPTKRLLYASFVLTYVINFFFIHSTTMASSYRGAEVEFIALGIPAIAVDLIMFSAILAYLFVTVSVIFSLRSELRRSVPALVLMLTQSVWFILPPLVKNWFPDSAILPLSTQYVSYSFTWIALGHAAQYLWITSYFANASIDSPRSFAFYWKVLLAGCAVWTVPALLFAPGVLGRLPYDVGLASMVAAIVNIHHFILDGAIWKLRDSRVASILLPKKMDVSVATPFAPNRHPILWRLAAGVGAAALVVSFLGIGEDLALTRALARSDLPAAEMAVEHLFWIGRDSHNNRRAVGTLAMRKGDFLGAQRHFEKDVGLYPTSRGWTDLGDAHAKRLDWRAAIEAYDEAILLDGDDQIAPLLRAVAYVELGDFEPAKELLAKPVASTGREGRLREKLTKRLKATAPG